MTWRNVLGMLVLVVVCGLLLLWMRDDGAGPDRGPATLLPPFDKGDVTELTLSGKAPGDKDVRLHLRRREGDSDRWDIQVGLEWARADGIAVDEILGSLVRADVRRRFPAAEVSDADRAQYGLAEPGLVAELQLPGKKLTARLGARSSEGGNVYADRGADADVLVVPTTAADEIGSALQGGLRDRRVTDLRPYDLKGIEISAGGVTTLEAERDVNQIWHVRQPFKGYADPEVFDTRMAHLLNEQWQRVVEDGVQDLARYGLAEPVATVKLISKRGAERVLLLGGVADEAGGGHFVAEQGYHSVVLVSQRFADAVVQDASEIRDRIFSRLGLGIEAVTVNIDGTAFTLRKAHTDWEIEKPVREPAEESVVSSLLEELRSWPVLEFLDGEDPAAYGVTPDGDQIQIESEGGTLTTLLIGNEAGDGGRYAQRKEDGALVRVLGGPVQHVLRGWLQFKRRAAFDIAIDDVDFIGREAGDGPDAEGCTDEKWERDLGGQDRAWRPGLGRPGAGLDADAMTALLSALRSITTRAWHHLDPAHVEEMGFHKQGGKAATAWIEIGFRSSDADVFLEIGSRVPGKSTFYAKQRGKPFVFEVDEDVVKVLTAPLMRSE